MTTTPDPYALPPHITASLDNMVAALRNLPGPARRNATRRFVDMLAPYVAELEQYDRDVAEAADIIRMSIANPDTTATTRDAVGRE